MKLDKKLNLVIPIETDGGIMYVHATPISKEVFERYYLVIAKTFARMHGEGLNFQTGPRVAALLLKEVASGMPGYEAGDATAWEGASGVARGLLAEVTRLSNVLMPSEKGWAMTPLYDVINQRQITADDASEVENSLVFFTVASSMYPKRDLEGILDFASKIWGGRIVSSSCTEFMSSLPMSMPDASIGVKTPEALSIPS